MGDLQTLVQTLDLFHPHPFGIDQDSSRDAWESVRDSGWAGEAMTLVYRVMRESGVSMTREEIRLECERRRGSEGRHSSTYMRRFGDLQFYGLIEKDSRRECQVLGKDVNTYRLTDTLLPEKRPPGRWTQLMKDLRDLVSWLDQQSESPTHEPRTRRVIEDIRNRLVPMIERAARKDDED